MFMHELNTMTSFFLLLLLASYLVETVALLLDIKHLHQPMSAQLTSLMDQETWHKMQTYTQAKHQLDLLGSLVGLLALVLFWLLGGFNSLDIWVNRWQLGPISSGVLYIGTLMIFSYLLNLPFVLYGIFAIESRFGFNRATVAIFVTDQIKMLIISLLLGGPFLAAVLALFYHAGPLAWLYGWLGASLFSLLLQMIIPRWILPLFNRFSPLADGEVRQAILAYADSIQFPVADIFEMDGSRRSSKANAFLTGFGKNRRIALFDTLIQNHTVAELVAVLAHEIGHSKKKHIPKSVTIGLLHLGFLFFMLSFFLTWPALYHGFFMENSPIYAGLILFGILMGPLDLAFSLFIKKVSRRFEFEADRFAIETAPDGAALASALKTLAKGNLSNLTPHPFYVMLHHSHPPLLERLAAMEKNPASVLR